MCLPELLSLLRRGDSNNGVGLRVAEINLSTSNPTSVHKIRGITGKALDGYELVFPERQSQENAWTEKIATGLAVDRECWRS